MVFHSLAVIAVTNKMELEPLETSSFKGRKMVEIMTIATCSEYNAYKGRRAVNQVFNQSDRIILEQGE